MRKLIEILSDGEFHSGDALGQALGISRAGIWQKIEKLADVGLIVHRVKGKGYRLEAPLELLNSDNIQSALNAINELPELNVDLHFDLESTNDLALSSAILENSHGKVILAEYQRKGRGRRGRQWLGSIATNLYMSMIWHFHQGANQLSGLSLVVGVAIEQALKSLGVGDIQLKWPNDLMISGQKLGGVLVEVSGDLNSHCAVVIGIGLNIKMSKQAIVEIDQPWIDLASAGYETLSRHQIVVAIIRSLADCLKQFEAQGFAAFHQQWNQLNAFDHQRIKIQIGEKTLSGTCIGVDQSGGLKLNGVDGEDPNQHFVFHGGEIEPSEIHSLRPTDQNRWNQQD